MPGTVGQIERKTQQRVVKLFRDTLGYDYLGNRGTACGQTTKPSEKSGSDGCVEAAPCTGQEG
jgi:hypothetical protein